MTNEEKAKAYDEALERAKEALNDGTISSNTIAYLQDIFPELRESEDERIRKALIDFFNRGAKNGEQTNGVCDKDILTWLEKQKERSPLSKNEEYTLARIIEYLEDNDCPSEWKDLLYDVYALPYQKEQKPSWSEEDERIYQSIMDDTVQENQLNDKQTNWLKDIKYRYFPQPQNRWKPSDEQIGVIEAVINNRSFQRRHLDSLYEQLKKLKGEEL